MENITVPEGGFQKFMVSGMVNNGQLVYGVLLVLVLCAFVYLWKNMSAAKDMAQDNIAFRDFLDIYLVFMGTYAFMWIPILFLGVLDGNFSNSVLSSGIQGLIARAHCNGLSICTRTFCMFIALTLTIYISSDKVKIPESIAKRVHPKNIFFYAGLVLPFVVVVTIKGLSSLTGGGPAMPRNIRLGIQEDEKLVLELSPIFWFDVVTGTWLSQVLVEWFLTIGICALLCYGLHGEKKIWEYFTNKSFEGTMLESVTLLGCLWSLVFRPITSVYFYIMYEESSTNFQELTTHVFIISTLCILPFEISSLSKSKVEEAQKRDVVDIVQHPKAREAQYGQLADDRPIWIINEDKITLLDNGLTKEADGTDAKPIWIQDNTLKVHK